jgi:hypothetical protein
MVRCGEEEECINLCNWDRLQSSLDDAMTSECISPRGLWLWGGNIGMRKGRKARISTNVASPQMGEVEGGRRKRKEGEERSLSTHWRLLALVQDGAFPTRGRVPSKRASLLLSYSWPFPPQPMTASATHPPGCWDRG